MKKNIYHRDDIIKIVNPQFVTRVGYPLCLNDMLEEIYNSRKEGDIHNFISQFTGQQCGGIFVSQFGKAFEEIRRALAYAMLQNRKFGGPERKVHTKLVEEDRDKICRVVCKKVVYSGTYSNWDGDWDEPATLVYKKAHVLLEVLPRSNTIPLIRSSEDYEHWIEDINVEKI